LACATPAAGAGLLEDVSKRVSPSWRLLAALVSGAMALVWMQTALHPELLALLQTAPTWLLAALGFTVVVGIAGCCNAFNLIDGFNGLSAGCGAIALLCIAAIAQQVGDSGMVVAALACAGAAVGFMLLNYPRGHIFMGDGGAYLMGFVVAVLALLLPVRNPQVSMWLPLVMCCYPIFETLFTMWRRAKRSIRSVFLPDSLHLHSLIYRRLTRALRTVAVERRQPRRNALTAPYLWALCSLPCLGAVAGWWHWVPLLACVLALMAAYLHMYLSIVRWQAFRLSGLGRALFRLSNRQGETAHFDATRPVGFR
jgi:UDP-N-acetylmuramyl pentapeptide phosphotransferase/UDP-N-acetylglucosamine-1-phosphate transferase